VANYVMAARTQGAVHKGASMDIEIEASLPALKKQGRFHALRRISPLGLITYERRLFEGDNTVRNQVILRYLNAEAEEKLQVSGWLISAILAEFNHLRGPVRDQA